MSGHDEESNGITGWRRTNSVDMSREHHDVGESLVVLHGGVPGVGEE